MTRRQFHNKFSSSVLEDLLSITNKKLELLYILNENQEYYGSTILENGGVTFSGITKISVVLCSNNEIYILPIKGNIPSENLDFIYQYKSDILNLNVDSLSKISIENYSSKRTLFTFIDSIEIIAFDTIELLDKYQYIENKNNVILDINIDIGLIITLAKDRFVSMHMDDKSLLNVNYYPNLNSLNSAFTVFNNRFYDGKLTINRLNQ